jgi:hypothetical protein
MGTDRPSLFLGDMCIAKVSLLPPSPGATHSPRRTNSLLSLLSPLTQTHEEILWSCGRGRGEPSRIVSCYLRVNGHCLPGTHPGRGRGEPTGIVSCYLRGNGHCPSLLLRHYPSSSRLVTRRKIRVEPCRVIESIERPETEGGLLSLGLACVRNSDIPHDGREREAAHGSPVAASASGRPIVECVQHPDGLEGKEFQ